MGIRKISTYSVAGILSLALVITLTAQVMAATKVNLGTAANFAVLAGSEITNVPTSAITGNVGLSPASGSFYAGLTQAEVTGTIYDVDGAGPGGSVNNPGLLTTAKNDLTTAYLEAAGQVPTQTFVAGDNQLGGQSLNAGVYAFGHANTANITAADPLILNGQGNPDAVFIFQASSDLVTASGSVVQLINGAQACNVFWQVTSSTTLGTNSTFVGTIMSLTSGEMTTGADLEGRILSRNGAVNLDSNTITIPSTCTTNGGGSSSGGSGGSTVPGVPNTSRSTSKILPVFTSSL
jgi:ice-binding like protein